jgi:hypothetical protein
MYVIDWLAHLLTRKFEDRERSRAHHLKAWLDDQTDALHGGASQDVPKRRLND